VEEVEVVEVVEVKVVEGVYLGSPGCGFRATSSSLRASKIPLTTWFPSPHISWNRTGTERDETHENP
jgi:hypothetical protein